MSDQEKLDKVGPYGGLHGGAEWNDGTEHNGPQIHWVQSIDIWFETYVNAIQATYLLDNGEEYRAPLHGATWGTKQTINFRPGEVIKEVNLRTGSLIDSIEFTTQMATYGPYGGGGGGVQNVAGYVKSFFGRSGDSIDAIGFYTYSGFMPGVYTSPVYAKENSIAGAPDQRETTPAIITFSPPLKPGDSLTITVPVTETWQSGGGPDTTNADGVAVIGDTPDWSTLNPGTPAADRVPSTPNAVNYNFGVGCLVGSFDEGISFVPIGSNFKMTVLNKEISSL